jgi:hypothetical protein
LSLSDRELDGVLYRAGCIAKPDLGKGAGDGRVWAGSEMRNLLDVLGFRKRPSYLIPQMRIMAEAVVARSCPAEYGTDTLLNPGGCLCFFLPDRLKSF